MRGNFSITFEVTKIWSFKDTWAPNCDTFGELPSDISWAKRGDKELREVSVSPVIWAFVLMGHFTLTPHLPERLGFLLSPPHYSPSKEAAAILGIKNAWPMLLRLLGILNTGKAYCSQSPLWKQSSSQAKEEQGCEERRLSAGPVWESERHPTTTRVAQKRTFFF